VLPEEGLGRRDIEFGGVGEELNVNCVQEGSGVMFAISST